MTQIAPQQPMKTKVQVSQCNIHLLSLTIFWNSVSFYNFACLVLLSFICNALSCWSFNIVIYYALVNKVACQSPDIAIELRQRRTGPTGQVPSTFGSSDVMPRYPYFNIESPKCQFCCVRDKSTLHQTWNPCGGILAWGSPSNKLFSAMFTNVNLKDILS